MAQRRGGKTRRGGRGNSNTPKYPRSARVGETLREIIAEDLVRIDDERLEFVTVTSIDVDPELNRAIVYFDSLAGEDGDEEIVEALDSYRVRLQASIARQIRAKKTPILQFRPDVVIRSAERIDDILRADRERSNSLDLDSPTAESARAEPDASQPVAAEPDKRDE
jgi:ribosome-binding factor A